jgi:plastocyanin
MSVGGECGIGLASGNRVSSTFTSPRIYNYVCVFHQGVIGRVVVTSS